MAASQDVIPKLKNISIPLVGDLDWLLQCPHALEVKKINPISHPCLGKHILELFHGTHQEQGAVRGSILYLNVQSLPANSHKVSNCVEASKKLEKK